MPASFEVLRAPGVAGPFAAGLVARLPLGAVGLVLILHVRALGHGYGAAGLVAGVLALATGASAPLLGRAIDRVGQTRVLLIGAVLAAGALGAIAALGHAAPEWAILALAAITGTTLPPIGSCMRVLWSDLVELEQLHGALSLEAAALELTYLLGPLILVGVVAAISTTLAVACCAVLVAGGNALFALTHASRRWRPAERTDGSRPWALASAGVRLLLATSLLAGVSFGAIEVASAALCQRAGSPHAVGPLLALWGLASMAGGLISGSRPAPRDPLARIAALLGIIAVGNVLATFASGIPLLAVALVVAGVAIAPYFALALGLTTALGPMGAATEATTWLSTGTTAGMAVGSAGAGALIGWSGVHAGFALGAAAVALAAAIVAVAPRGRPAAEPS